MQPLVLPAPPAATSDPKGLGPTVAALARWAQIVKGKLEANSLFNTAQFNTPAIPAAPGDLLGGSGTEGQAAVVAVGSGLSLSGGTLTATGLTLAELTAVIAALPTSLPATSGVLWLNGGVVQLS
jgi:hypothetical protein